MTNYKLRPANRQEYSAVSLHFLIKDLAEITSQAVRHGIPRTTLLTRAIRAGLPIVLERLEAIDNARKTSQTKEGNEK